MARSKRFQMLEGPFRGPSQMRVVILAEAWPADPKAALKLMDAMWPQFAASIKRRQLTPRGQWMVSLYDQSTDFHDIVLKHVADRVDAGLRDHPELVPVCLALVDSEDAEPA